MNITVYTDIHLGAPHAMKDFDLFEEAKKRNVFFTGDIFDIKNTKKSKLKEFKEQRDKLKEIAGDRYVYGNHECIKPDKYYHVKNGILFCHGHTIFWDEEKVKRWERKKGGMNRFEYFFYRFKHRGVYRGKKINLSLEAKEKCYDLCVEHDCHTIVFGHTHKFCDIEYKGKRFINAARGKTDITGV